MLAPFMQPPSPPSPAPYGRIARLSLPTVTVAFAQAACQTLEVAFIGRLGTEVLAGYALVLPLLLLMQMMSTGAMGGGVSSAIARALGAGRRDEASALVLHAGLIGIAMGLLFTVVIEAFGPSLFVAMGGSEAAVAHATAYARVIFAGSVLVWLANTLGAVLRGAGNMRLPANIMLVAWAFDAAVSITLLTQTSLGIAGAGIAYVLTFLVACIAMVIVIRRGGAGFMPSLRARLDAALFRRILSVGLIASAMASIANLTTVLVTALVSRHGSAAIAAYGVGVRLEFLMIPLAYGIGAALTALVGMRVGAGDWAGARTTAWRGAVLAGAISGMIGAAVTFAPGPFANAFATDADVQAAIRLYLVVVGPSFAALGVGMALYFASQGAGRMRIPFIASLARISVAVLGGMWAGDRFGLGGLFAAVSAGLASYGLIVASSVRPGVWSARRV
ncbi:MATE family efflux transporter [Elioraea sp.]|uniref:MATE family efflux transporter n=1 Tax=Elioraea sp. TaxID=2185103 RepID=UPI0025C35C55|nr:MATE family efflux transporter [Elioraea sp.]